MRLSMFVCEGAAKWLDVNPVYHHKCSIGDMTASLIFPVLSDRTQHIITNHIRLLEHLPEHVS